MLQWLRLGSSGSDVTRWQNFLRGQLPRGTTTLVADGEFGPATEAATRLFQTRERLDADGVVGNQTLIAAAKRGYQLAVDQSAARTGPDWPTCPTLIRPLTPTEREALFGRFTFTPAPTADNPEGIKITDDWERKNVTYVSIPQIDRVVGKSRKVGIHIRLEKQFKDMWKAWDDAALLNRVLTFGGTYVPRFIRGSRTNLSNHSWATALDINAQWNRLGSQAALLGEKGCVRELVDIAVEHGYFWGNWFGSRADGMHFEAFKVIT